MLNEVVILLLYSYYDSYRGVIVYFRVVDGRIKKGDRVYFMASGKVNSLDTQYSFYPHFISYFSSQHWEVWIFALS